MSRHSLPRWITYLSYFNISRISIIAVYVNTDTFLHHLFEHRSYFNNYSYKPTLAKWQDPKLKRYNHGWEKKLEKSWLQVET